jgi:hypothetical protein
MKRRQFIRLFGGAAAWPLAVRAQQGDRARRIGVLLTGDETGPLEKTFASAFTQAIAGSGWTEGRNVRMDLRWPGTDINRIRALAQELVAPVGQCRPKGHLLPMAAAELAASSGQNGAAASGQCLILNHRTDQCNSPLRCGGKGVPWRGRSKTRLAGAERADLVRSSKA